MRSLMTGLGLLIAFACTGCAGDPADAFLGLWAGTLVETQTDRATGEITTTPSRASNLRFSRDGDGLFIDGRCAISARATSSTSVRILPTPCESPAGRIDVVSGMGTIEPDGTLQMHTEATLYDSSGAAVLDLQATYLLTRTE